MFVIGYCLSLQMIHKIYGDFLTSFLQRSICMISFPLVTEILATSWALKDPTFLILHAWRPSDAFTSKLKRLWLRFKSASDSRAHVNGRWSPQSVLESSLSHHAGAISLSFWVESIPRIASLDMTQGRKQWNN